VHVKACRRSNSRGADVRNR